MAADEVPFPHIFAIFPSYVAYVLQKGHSVGSCSNLNFEIMGSEQLLTLCAMAIEEKNEAVTQQAVCALRNKSSVDGEPSERATAYFMQALLLRASNTMLNPIASLLVSKTEQPKTEAATQWTEKLLSLDELISLVDMTPYYRFGYVAANGALLEAFKGKEQVHILDFSTTHCMQWPTLIQALADHLERPPHVRLTVSSTAAQTLATTSPRLGGATYKDLGCRLTKFAASRGVPFEFHVVSQPLEDLKPSHFDLQEGECLAVNCAFRSHYLADESLTVSAQVNHSEYYSRSSAARAATHRLSQCNIHADGGADESVICARDKFFQLIHGFNPAVVTLYEEDCDTTSTNVLCRLKESYEHEWIPFDFLATILPEGDENRVEYEKILGRKIENIISCEGLHRVERLESKEKWVQRMRRLQFRSVPLGEDVVMELKDLVADHASGWGFKVNVEDHTQSLTWKNHSLVFASAWAPV